MRISYTLSFLSILFCFTHSYAQKPFLTKQYVDIGNIKAAMLVHGDMLWDADTAAQCEFPKGSGIHAAFVSTVWMSGYDGQNQLHVSSQTYRQSGNDYWPGPLDNNGNLDHSTSEKWARIWKVNFFDINNHLNNGKHTFGNTPTDILEWPAKDNPYAKGNNGASLTITTDMAPFVDVDQDGKYNALAGDYPEIKGDQMLWWVFSDNGPTHDNIPAQPFKVQVRASAYAYTRNTIADNIIFFNYQLTNKSPDTYSDFRLGLFSDIDLGYYRDDYIGFDSARRLGYAYNGTSVDGNGQTVSYGATPPIAGFAILQFPGDNSTALVPAGSFMTYNNDNTVSGNPQNAAEYSHYMRSRFRDGQHLVNDYMPKVPSDGRGAGSIANYMFPGNPADTTQWTECGANNPVGDRRFVISTNDLTFNSNASIDMTLALVISDRGANNTCPGVDITTIQKVADTAHKYFNNPPKSYVSVNDVNKTEIFKTYPNPVKDKLKIILSDELMNSALKVWVHDVTGRVVSTPVTNMGRSVEVNTSGLPSGTYSISVSANGLQASQLFIKE